MQIDKMNKAQRSLLIGREDEFAHGADVPQAVRLCHLQLGQRGHRPAGEVPESRAGWLHGIQKYLAKKKGWVTVDSVQQTFAAQESSFYISKLARHLKESHLSVNWL